MKKISEIMKELGFDPTKPEGAQKAFILSLLKEAQLQQPRTNKYQESSNVLVLKEKQRTKPSGELKQMCFDLESLETNKKIKSAN